MENSKSVRENKERKTGQIIRIEQEQLTKHLDKVVRGTVEETLNALLDAEADRLCQASRYAMSIQRSARTRVLVIISATWKPKRVRSN
jgi:hypothetical protein